MHPNSWLRCLNGWFRPPHGFEQGYMVCIQIILISDPAHFNPLHTLHSLPGATRSASGQTSLNHPPPPPRSVTHLTPCSSGRVCARRDLGSRCIGGGDAGGRSVSARPSCGEVEGAPASALQAATATPARSVTAPGRRLQTRVCR